MRDNDRSIKDNTMLKNAENTAELDNKNVDLLARFTNLNKDLTAGNDAQALGALQQANYAKLRQEGNGL